MNKTNFEELSQRIQKEEEELNKVSVINSFSLWIGFVLFSFSSNAVGIFYFHKDPFFLGVVNIFSFLVGVIGLASTNIIYRIEFPPKVFYRIYIILWAISISLSLYYCAF